METLLIGALLFICALIGTACAIAPFFLHLNNKINDKYKLKEQSND